MRRRFSNGVTLAETLVAFSLFSIIGLILVSALVQAGDIWKKVSGGSTAQLNLRKASGVLIRDFRNTSFESISIHSGSASLGYEDGSALCLLSAVDPATGRFVRRSDGTPFWQRNILYYLTVPERHEDLFGGTCAGLSDGSGYELSCPHKVLVRKVIDARTVTDPADESTVEEPLDVSEVSKYLTRPDGLDTSAMLLEDGVDAVSLTGTGYLTLRAQLAPDPKWPQEVRVQLGTVDVSNASSTIPIGSAPLKAGNPHRMDIELQLFPALP